MSTPRMNVALELFPTDAAEELKMYAEKHSFHCAKIRLGKRREADDDNAAAINHFASFKDKCKGLLSENSCQDINLMLGYAGWHAANTRKSEKCWRSRNRKGYEFDAIIDNREVEENYQNVVRKGEISETLAENVRKMGWCAAWFAADTIFGHDEESERQKAKLNSYFEKIHGKVNVAEILSRREREVSEEAMTPGFTNHVALEIFPLDIADELKGYAEKASSYCAKKRFGNLVEADVDNIEAKNHYDSFKKKCQGLLSHKSCQEIRSMLWDAAWHAANTTKSKRCWWHAKRNHYKSDAASDKGGILSNYQSLVNGGEISKTLATNVREMSCNAAWFAANTIIGHHDDAKRNKANLDSYFNKISKEVNLIDMKFIMDEAKILSQEPKVVFEQLMTNKSDIQQTMMFTFSVTEGRTRSTTHSIGFSYGIKASFSAGFSGFAACNYELSFNFSHNHSFYRSTRTGTTKSYEFPLVVPARTTYVAKGTVHEAVMDVPYELVFDFDGAHRSFKGRWKGVAYSKATYNIKAIDGTSPVPPDDDVDDDDVDDVDGVFRWLQSCQIS